VTLQMLAALLLWGSPSVTPSGLPSAARTGLDVPIVALNDGGARPRVMDRDNLAKRWRTAGSQALIIRRRSP
jgi:hypothetical protein